MPRFSSVLDASTSVFLLSIIKNLALIRELVAISAKFFKNGSKKTLVLASSAEEKRDVNSTSALGPLSTCMRQGNQATCRTR